MLAFPNAKINLGLNIISKRPDGYHNIGSCFYPIPWYDALEMVPANKMKFTTSGLKIPGNPENNLCLQAYHLLAEEHELPPVHIHLHKVIPTGAGLGGGSADGAFALKMLNDLFELRLSFQELEMKAESLGSDCPFFIQNKPVYATGTGTDFNPVDLDLTGKSIAIKHPEIHIGTKEAYSQVVPHAPKKAIPDVLKLPVQEWRAWLVNDFEDSVFSQHPQIRQLKDELYQKGALYASMSGSGSAVYGIFDFKPELEDWMVFKLGMT